MKMVRNKLFITVFAILAGGVTLAITLLHWFSRAADHISSVSWNL